MAHLRQTLSIILEKVSLRKGLKVKSQFGQHVDKLSSLSLHFPALRNSPFLFLSSSPLEYAPADSNEETCWALPWMHSLVENVQALPSLHCPSFIDSASSLSINIHCSANNTARPVWFDSRGTHFNSRKLSHPFLEVIRSRMIGVH